ncbi:TPA: pilus assembly protein, partial [Escherichia coli]|nr:pilus assembly protein [Escherichia coli]
MKMLSGINIPFFKKSKKDENGDLEQSYVKKDESAKGRFLDIKKRFSPQAEASGAGITYSALINRDTKLIRINTVSIAVIGLLVAKILFFTDPVTIVTPPNM